MGITAALCYICGRPTTAACRICGNPTCASHLESGGMCHSCMKRERRPSDESFGRRRR